MPYSQPVPSIWSGMRARARRSCRSARTASSTWIVNGSITRSRDDGGERLPAPDRRRRREVRVVDVDLPLREPLQHLVERDAPLDARKRGAEAEVDAVPEREVLRDVAV